MPVAPISPPIILSPSGSSHGAAADIKPGDWLIGRVVDRHPDGRYLVDFNSARSWAVIRFPIAIGDTILTEVSDTGPPLKLKIKPPQSSEQPNIKGELSDPFRDIFAIERQLRKDIGNLLRLATQQPGKYEFPERIFKSLNSIEAHLRPMNIGPDAMALLTRLSTQISDSGLYFEEKLNRFIKHFFQLHPAEHGTIERLVNASQPIFKSDIKPHLLVISKFFKQQELLRSAAEIHRHSNPIRTGVNLLLEYIGDQHRQLINNRTATDTASFFHHTIYFDKAGQKATLKIYHSPRRSDSGQKVWRISLLLNMNRLGDVRTDLSLFENNLQIAIFVSSDIIKQQFDQQLKELLTLLQGLGATPSCHVHVSQPKIDEFSKTFTHRSMDKIVDVRI